MNQLLRSCIALVAMLGIYSRAPASAETHSAALVHAHHDISQVAAAQMYQRTNVENAPQSLGDSLPQISEILIDGISEQLHDQQGCDALRGLHAPTGQ